MPKKTNKTQPKRIAQAFQEELMRTQTSFETATTRFKTIIDTNPDPELKKEEFLKLIPGIVALRQAITKVDTPEFQDVDFAHLQILKFFSYHQIILAYSYNDNNQAEKFIDSILPKNLALYILLDSIAIKYALGNYSDVRLLRKRLVEEAQYQHNRADLEKHSVQIQQEAYELLKDSLAHPGLDLTPDYLFSHTAQLFNSPILATVVDSYKNMPDIQTKWRNKLFGQLKTHNDATTYLPYYVQEIDYLFQTSKKNCFIFTKHLLSAYPKLLSPDQLSTIGYGLITQSEYSFSTKNMDNLIVWVIESAKSRSDQAVFYFLMLIIGQQNLHEAKQTLKIINDAVHGKAEQNRGLAHYILGLINNGEFSSTVKNNKAEALRHYTAAAALNISYACTNLGAMYADGDGVQADTRRALEYYDQSHRLKDPEGGLYWAQIYLSRMLQEPGENVSKGLEKALNYVRESENLLKELLNKKQGERKILDLFPKIALTKALCLWMKHQHTGNDSLPNSLKSELLDALSYAMQQGTDETKAMAANLLGECYSVEQDEEQALSYFKQAIDLCTNLEYSLLVEATLSLKCIYLLISLSVKQQSINKPQYTTLRSEALTYSHRVMSILGDEYSKDIEDASNPPMQNFYKSSAVAPKLPLHHVLTLPCVDYDKSPTTILKRLKIKLEDPKLMASLDTLFEISSLVGTAHNCLLRRPEFFPRLETLLIGCLNNIKKWDLETLNKVLQAIGKCYLSTATASLVRLLPPMPLGINFSDQIHLLKSLSQCNFSVEDQQDRILPYVKIISANSLLPAIASGDLTIKQYADVFYIMALFDANESNEAYLQLAKSVFTALKNSLANARFIDISQIYHAHKYFSLKYLDILQWKPGPDLKEQFELYQQSLQTNRAGKISATQAEIYKLVLELNVRAKQEYFIESAGRQVDIVASNLIIQYNGDRSHDLVDNTGAFAYHSLSENLSYTTLVLAAKQTGQKVVRILRDQWPGPVEQNMPEKRDYLRKKLPGLLEATKSKLEVTEERKKPEAKEEARALLASR